MLDKSVDEKLVQFFSELLVENIQLNGQLLISNFPFSHTFIIEEEK
jgi:hypothetical protein